MILSDLIDMLEDQADDNDPEVRIVLSNDDATYNTIDKVEFDGVNTIEITVS